MPADAFRHELADQDPIEALPGLATAFRTSQSAVAIRLRTLGIIDQPTLDGQLAIAVRLGRERRERAKARAKERSGGPPHHIVHLRNLSLNYVSTVLDALDDRRISAVDATYYLESKLPTIDRMRAELIRKSTATSHTIADPADLDALLAASD
jgi:hypothetical protein